MLYFKSNQKTHLISYSEYLAKEFIKSLIFKTLIAIDRSRNMQLDQILKQWNKHIAIEQAYYEKMSLYSQAQWAVKLQQQLIKFDQCRVYVWQVSFLRRMLD